MVLRLDEIGQQVLTDLAEMPTASSLDSLSDAYTAEHDGLLTEQQTYRSLLLGYSALLLLLFAYYG